jgi:hypothetical protein
VWGSNKAQPAIQVRDLRWGLRVGVFADSGGPSTGTGRRMGAKPARPRRRIQLAGAAGIFFAGSAFGLHEYMPWRSNPLGLQLQAWVQPGLGAPQLEAEAPLGQRTVGLVRPLSFSQSTSDHAPETMPRQLSQLTRERHARMWQRVRVRLPRATRNEADPQLGPVQSETRSVPGSSPIPTSAGFSPVSGHAFDPPLTAPASTASEPPPIGKVASANHALDQPVSTNNPPSLPQRDRSARRHMDRRHQGLVANILRNINDVLNGAWSTVRPRRVQVGSRSK